MFICEECVICFVIFKFFNDYTQKSTYCHASLNNFKPIIDIIRLSACSVGWFISLLVREEVLLAGLCEKNTVPAKNL